MVTTFSLNHSSHVSDVSHISFYSHEDHLRKPRVSRWISSSNLRCSLRLAMANLNETKTDCECRNSPEDDSAKIASFNNAPNIHEIDEESETEETEETTILEQPNPSTPNEKAHVARETKDASDDESTYTGESFYSDESCDESEITNVASRSLNPSSSLRIAHHRRRQNSKEFDEHVSELRWKDGSYSMSDEQSRATTADKLIRSQRCRRWNMSFTDEEMRKIERENELLLRKIMAQQKPRHKILGERSVQSRTSSSGINRKKLQKRIEDDNMLLLRRIQQAKSCVFANASKMGCRLTFL